MTVADNTSRNQYTATSGQTVFAYTFEIVDKSHIVVLKNGVALSEGTNYTVSNVGNDSGGNITLTVGATTGDIMTFYRDMPYSRTQNYTNSGDFLASEVNSDFDDLWLAGEQTDRSFSQSIRKPITDSDSISMELPEAASRVNSFLTFDSTGAVSVESLSSGTGPTVIGRQQFTGDGTTTVFTLAATSSSAAAVIYIDGVYQEEGTYTVSGTTLTFTEAPPTNASIEVLAYKITDVGTTDANAVTYTPAGTGAVQTTVQTKLRESANVKDFGAVGDGVTDDTAAIQAAATAHNTLLVPSGTFLITSEYVDANLVGGGVVKTSSKVIYDGGFSETIGKLTLANDRECRLAASGLRGDLKSSIRKVNNNYVVNRHLGGDNWLQITMSNSGQVSGNDTPWKITSQKVFEATGFLTGKDAVEGGTWATYNSGSDIYVGHQLKQSNSAGNTLTFTSTFGGDVALCFTGDTDGGIVEVTVDGGSAIDVDTYSSTANDYRQFTTFVTGLSYESHTIVVTSTSRKNVSSTGTQANITGLRILNGPILPYGDLFQAKPWKPNTTARAYEEVQASNGNFYYTVAGGTTGSTEPSHTSGSASDGGVTWAITARTSFSQKSTEVQKAGSELEYAYEIKPEGESTLDDVGGNVHGNEYVISTSVLVDNTESVVTEQDLIGYNISFKQVLKDYYGSFATKTDVADVIQIHNFNSYATTVSYDMTFLVNAELGYFYACMQPFLVYGSPDFTKNFESMSSPTYTFEFSDYESDATNPIIGNAKDFWLEAKGRCYVEKGSGGVPTSDNGEIGLYLGLKADIAGLNYYRHGLTRCGFSMNANNGQYTGYSSWLAKMYFQRSSVSKAESVTSGQKISNKATYYTILADNNSDVSAL